MLRISHRVTGSQVWWCTLGILTVGRQKQEDRKFEDSLGYTGRHCFKKLTNEKKERMGQCWWTFKWLDRNKRVSTACKSPGPDCHQWFEGVACVQLLRTGTEAVETDWRAGDLCAGALGGSALRWWLWLTWCSGLHGVLILAWMELP
jgi:hypothetical protein